MDPIVALLGMRVGVDTLEFHVKSLYGSLLQIPLSSVLAR